MIVEAIDRILALAKPTMVEVHGLQYSTTVPNLVPPPSAAAYTVHTLDGFVKMLEAGVDNFSVDETTIHIPNEETVNLVQKRATEYGKRIMHLTAGKHSGVTTFPYFGQWGPQEEFTIGLQAHFQPSPDLDYLMKMVTHIDSQSSVVTADNSVAQAVTVKQGIAFKETVEVKSRLSLKPFRTFRELDQPASDFIFRIKEAGSKFSLFEADGGAWKIAAIGQIAEWLKNRINTSNVAELQKIPIIT